MAENAEQVETTAVPGDEKIIEEAHSLARQPAQGESILSIIKDAVLNKADVAVMHELLNIRREERADQAREAFANALVQFQALVRPVIMTGHRDDTKTRKRDGAFGSVRYDYAELTTTIEQIRPALDQCGLIPTWRMVKNDPGWVELECVVTHILGHKESSLPFGAPPEGSSGQTAVQKRMGTITSLQRKTLFMVLGLVTKEDDRHLRDAEQGTEPPKPQAGALLNADAEERQAREAFRAKCLEKTGEENLPNAVLRKLLAAAGAGCGFTEMAACVEYIGRPEVGVGKDGTLSILTGPPGPAGEEAGPLLGTETGGGNYECDQCLTRYKVKPAGGKCSHVNEQGTKCPGQVSRVME
ncbi:MAG: hypothetical protein V2A79_09985 [Planctomycetota bacterium]